MGFYFAFTIDWIYCYTMNRHAYLRMTCVDSCTMRMREKKVN